MTQTTVALRPVALPTEHGGWSLTLEPVVLGLMVEPGWAGLALGTVAILGFVARTEAGARGSAPGAKPREDPAGLARYGD